MPDTSLTQLREQILHREARLRWVEHQLLLTECDGEMAALLSEQDCLERWLVEMREAYDEQWLRAVLRGAGDE